MEIHGSNILVLSNNQFEANNETDTKLGIYPEKTEFFAEEYDYLKTPGDEYLARLHRDSQSFGKLDKIKGMCKCCKRKIPFRRINFDEKINYEDQIKYGLDFLNFFTFMSAYVLLNFTHLLFSWGLFLCMKYLELHKSFIYSIPVAYLIFIMIMRELLYISLDNNRIYYQNKMQNSILDDSNFFLLIHNILSLDKLERYKAELENITSIPIKNIYPLYNIKEIKYCHEKLMKLFEEKTLLKNTVSEKTGCRDNREKLLKLTFKIKKWKSKALELIKKAKFNNSILVRFENNFEPFNFYVFFSNETRCCSYNKQSNIVLGHEIFVEKVPEIQLINWENVHHSLYKNYIRFTQLKIILETSQLLISLFFFLMPICLNQINFKGKIYMNTTLNILFSLAHEKIVFYSYSTILFYSKYHEELICSHLKNSKSFLLFVNSYILMIFQNKYPINDQLNELYVFISVYIIINIFKLKYSWSFIQKKIKFVFSHYIEINYTQKQLNCNYEENPFKIYEFYGFFRNLILISLFLCPLDLIISSILFSLSFVIKAFYLQYLLITSSIKRINYHDDGFRAIFGFEIYLFMKYLYLQILLFLLKENIEDKFLYMIKVAYVFLSITDFGYIVNNLPLVHLNYYPKINYSSANLEMKETFNKQIYCNLEYLKEKINEINED